MKETMLFLHIILASFWVGGMLFLVFVVSPIARKLPIRDQLFQEAGRRFSFFGTLGALSMLAITGLFNVHYLMGLSRLTDFSSPYTKTLLHKIAVFILVVFVSLAHDLYFGPRAVGSSFYRFMARLFGLLNLLLSLLIVYLAVKLRFGG